MFADVKPILHFMVILAWLASTEVHAAVVDGSRIMDQDMTENLCALTFDDGPSVNTPTLLDMLAGYGIPATFFLLGQNVMLYPQIVDRMLAEGHEVGNHSWSHPNLKKLGPNAQAEQIGATDRILRSHGATPFYIRPPYGSFDENTVKVAEDLGISVILWSMDSRDWKKLPEDYSKLVSTRGTVYEPGELRGIFLFHDTHQTTVDALSKIVADLKAGGCDRFVTVSEYLQGISDPEPGSLMTRRPTQIVKQKEQIEELWLRYPAGVGPVPLARSSKPWQEKKTAPLDLDEAQAAMGKPGTGI